METKQQNTKSVPNPVVAKNQHLRRLGFGSSACFAICFDPDSDVVIFPSDCCLWAELFSESGNASGFSPLFACIGFGLLLALSFYSSVLGFGEIANCLGCSLF